MLYSMEGFLNCLTYVSRTTMHFDNGSGPCGGGRKNRSTIIDLICGDSNDIMQVHEPIECVYNIYFSLICS